jgi:hypothetical protein
VDITFSKQTDPGVQAEFFERLYTRFEQRDNELHYRKAEGADYWNASVRVRLNDFRSQIEKLPSAGFFHGTTPIGSLGPVLLEYSGSVDAERLRRRQGLVGEPGEAAVIEGFTEYFEEFFDDPQGDRDVTRVDTKHALEAPMSLPAFGLRARPYLRTQLTGWDQGVLAEEEFGRAGAFAGMELASTFWRKTPRSITDITPTFRYEEELDVVGHDDTPVRFDSLDDPIDGNRVDVGLRTRWKRIGAPRLVDFELRNVRIWDRADETHVDNLLAVGNMTTELFGLPFAMRHDLRYDRRDGDVDYWRGALGLAPFHNVNLEFAYTRASIVDDPLLAAALEQKLFEPRFEAFSSKVRWRLTPKWEVDYGQTISLLDDGRLGSELTLRRFGHDFLVEIEISTRSGEGAGFGLSFTPLLTYKPDRIGLLE